MLAVALYFAENGQAQKLQQYKKMYETQIPGYGIEDLYNSYCINFSKTSRVCKSMKSVGGDVEILIQENGQTLQTIKSNIGSFTDRFWVYKGNLDKEFSDELVIVDFNSSSNGIMISHSTVYIFTDINKKDFQTYVKFPMEEFGENDNFIFDKKRNETLILATEWDGHTNFDKNRSWGLYLIGRWFRFRNKKLKPVFDKPNLARRYLFSFEKERWKTLDKDEMKPRPYLWLKNPNTRKFFSEPKENFEFISSQTGFIENYEETNIDDNIEREFTVHTDEGKTIICRFGFPNFSTKDKYEGKYSIGDFGILPRKFIFPYNFSPFSIFDKLKGKKVKIETYRDEFGRKFSYFWFVEK